jgi:hypothetical protein
LNFSQTFIVACSGTFSQSAAAAAAAHIISKLQTSKQSNAPGAAAAAACSLGRTPGTPLEHALANTHLLLLLT